MPENIVVIGLGSNLEPEVNIKRALDLLELKVKKIAVSNLEYTSPIGIADQPDFLNGAVLVHTCLSRKQLDIQLKAVEDEMGRDRSVPKFGPRIIDLDIIIWNNEVVDDDFYKRDFLRRAVEQVINI